MTKRQLLEQGIKDIVEDKEATNDEKIQALIDLTRAYDNGKAFIQMMVLGIESL